MLDLVGTPNCWFSHAQAQITFQMEILSCLSFGLLYEMKFLWIHLICMGKRPENIREKYPSLKTYGKNIQA